MVFDYYDHASTDMGDSAITAVQGLHTQLMQLLPVRPPPRSGRHRRHDHERSRRPAEEAGGHALVQDAQQLLTFAQANGMTVLSMWAIQRDNGGCPGNTGANNCSGIVQNTWDFTNALKGFTGP